MHLQRRPEKTQEHLGNQDKEMKPGTRLMVTIDDRDRLGEYLAFERSRVGDNKHTIRFDTESEGHHEVKVCTHSSHGMPHFNVLKIQVCVH
jgi:hypothetical protein